MAERVIPPAPWENIPPAPWETLNNESVVEDSFEDESLSLEEVIEQYPLGEIEVDTDVTVEETGETVQIQETAEEALGFTEERLSAYTELLNSLGKKSLPASLKSVKKFSEFEIAEIETATEKLASAGYGKEAAQQAVADIIDGLQEQRQSVIIAIEEALGITIKSELA